MPIKAQDKTNCGEVRIEIVAALGITICAVSEELLLKRELCRRRVAVTFRVAASFGPRSLSGKTRGGPLGRTRARASSGPIYQAEGNRD